jgi:hypothetical protein
MVLILAYPGDVYKGMLEAHVAKLYEAMEMIVHYELIRFSKGYAPFKNEPDYSITYPKKGMQFTMHAFIDQQAEGFANIHRPFVRSIYLFNSEHNGLILPDLDAIHIAPRNDSMDLVSEIQIFYQSFGWKTGLGKDIWTLQVPNDHPERFKKFSSITILNPKNIIDAARLVGYSDTELYFKPSD